MVSRPGRPGGGEDESFSVTVWGAGGGKDEEEGGGGGRGGGGG